MMNDALHCRYVIYLSLAWQGDERSPSVPKCYKKKSGEGFCQFSMSELCDSRGFVLQRPPLMSLTTRNCYVSG
jgi:hypothetical protein